MRRSTIGALALLALISFRAADAAPCFVPGGFTGSPTLNYSCPDWGISWSVSSWNITNPSGSNITVTMSPGPLPTLTGTINCADSTFTASVFLTDFCFENYTLRGKFTSYTHWTGTFEAWYGNYCDMCPAQNFPVQGTHVVAAVPGGPLQPFRLSAQPNPMRDDVTITLDLARPERVLLEVVDVSGRRARLLENGELSGGAHHYRWDRTLASGRRAPAGVYLVRARAPQGQRVARVIAAD